MIVNHNVVMTCAADLLSLLCEAMEVRTVKGGVKIQATKLRAALGTKLANSATLSADYTAGTLDHAVLCNAALNQFVFSAETEPAKQEPRQEEPQAEAPKGKRAASKSAKDWLRELLSAENAEFTLAELIALSGKTEVNIRTMLSDLRSPKYCGKGGVFATKSVRKDGKVFYSKA